MSAGGFSRTRYLSDTGLVHPGRTQPETAQLVIEGIANASITAAVTSGFRFQVGRAKDACGLLPRKVNVVFTGTLPNGYKADQTYCIPVFDPAVWAAISVGNTGTYLGEAIEVIGKTAEDIN